MFFKSCILPVFVILLFAGCESTNMFRSEKAVAKKLEGRWEMIRFVSYKPHEEWIFSNKTVSIVYTDSGYDIHGDSGYYSVDTKLASVHLVISDLGHPDQHLSERWSVVELRDDRLIIVNDAADNGALTTREFTKK